MTIWRVYLAFLDEQPPSAHTVGDFVTAALWVSLLIAAAAAF